MALIKCESRYKSQTVTHFSCCALVVKLSIAQSKATVGDHRILASLSSKPWLSQIGHHTIRCNVRGLVSSSRTSAAPLVFEVAHARCAAGLRADLYQSARFRSMLW